MIIIAGYELVDAEKRDSIVDAHRDLVSRASTFQGCLHVAITADSVAPDRINSVEVWQDAEAMEEWRGQASAPEAEAVRFTLPQIVSCFLGMDPLVLDFQVDQDRVDEEEFARVTTAIQEVAKVPVTVRGPS